MRRSIDAWNRGDFDGWLESVHPDMEFRTSGLYPGLEPIYRGLVELRHFWNDFRDPWESLHIDVDDAREVGNRVVALCTFHGHAREGLSVQREAAMVWTFVNGLVISVESYGSWKEALDAIGLHSRRIP